MNNHTEEQVKSWERHISTVASTIVIALMIWLGSSVINMGNDITAIKVKLEAAVDIQHTLNAIITDHAEMRGRFDSISEKVARMAKDQASEDVRERKEHGRL